TGSRLHEITAKPVASISFVFGRFEQRYTAINKILSAIAEQSGATLIDPIPYLCPQMHCPVFDADGRPLYLDAAHLTRSYAIRAATYIDATLDPSIARKEDRTQ
ncbi:MAG TPA: SGNH hydrolase domain-containing protein, partial [Xanthobacteraceae bacterium]|nr:SGNH hydrolase domain-containing protein [Xanthobacteraceae bacterium]